VLDILDEDTLASVGEKGLYIRSAIEAMGLSCFGSTRGMGLMIGVEVTGERTNRELAALLNQNGLLC
jgi:acetylornithine/N-succinyldiaminopimelate aminotransferase